MFFRNALISVLHLVCVFCLFSLSLFAFLLFVSENFRATLLEHLFAHPEECLVWAGGLFFLTLLMVLGCWVYHHGSYVRFKMGRHIADLNIGLIRSSLEQYLKAHFLHSVQLRGVAISCFQRLEIEVSASLEAAEKLEAELTPFLQKELGIFTPFYLTIRSLG